jgi:hypothetical protein
MMKAKYWALICLFVYSLCLFGMYAFESTWWFWLLLLAQAISVVAAYLIIRACAPDEYISTKQTEPAKSWLGNPPVMWRIIDATRTEAVLGKIRDFPDMALTQAEAEEYMEALIRREKKSVYQVAYKQGWEDSKAVDHILGKGAAERMDDQAQQ